MELLETRRETVLGEETRLHRTAGGMRVALVPKAGFSTAAASIGLRFGSTHTRFRLPDGREVQVPDGSAHFLEHKLFEGREESVMMRFGRLGAQFNGGTGFHSTTYYFSSAGHFDECLEILLDFVQHPRITEERVEKEKGIIEQEVRMYEDDPRYRGHFLLLRALYHVLPIRVPPGGSVASVRETRAEHLQACWEGFYRPAKLVLTLAGELDAEAVLARVESLLEDGRPGAAEPLPVAEPPEVAAPWLEEEFAVARPRAWIGWRAARGPGGGEAMVRQQWAGSLLADLALGDASAGQEELRRRGLADDSFAAAWSCDLDYGHLVVSGQCDDPEAFAAGVREVLARFREEGPREEDLERLRRAAWGWTVSRLQTPFALANAVLHDLLDDTVPFSGLEVLASITREEVAALAREVLDPARSAVAVLRPRRG